MVNKRWLVALLALAVPVSAVLAQAKDRETKVRGDKAKVEASGFWIYNDLPRGYAEARKTGKPLLVVFRCIPCEQCAQLDEEVVEQDPAVQALLKQFVCVRVVHANGMDLSLFQFDYDQSWAAFFLNADRTIYGRYGTRSHRTESEQDVSLQGFNRALQGALELHRGYPGNRAQLVAKTGAPATYPVPEKFPWFQGRYGSTLDYPGKVVQSCIHCHQVGEGMRLAYRTRGQVLPDSVLFPYPNPRVLGLQMDPKARVTVAAVAPGSPAQADGFRPGDEILSLQGQPVISTADIQWVLHHAPAAGKLSAQVKRGTARTNLSLTLAQGWRSRDDISWRATSWDLRRQLTGGLLLETATEEERRAAGVSPGAMALRVQHVGQFSPHDGAKRAGILKGDVVYSVDGRTDLARETDVLAMLGREKKPGDRLTLGVARGANRRDVTLTLQ